MSKTYPLVGYQFAIVQGTQIAVTGHVLQGHGDSGYLVRFDTSAPYARILESNDPVWAQMNLFATDEQLGDFIELVHKTPEPLAANDVVVDINGETLQEEDTDNPAVA